MSVKTFQTTIDSDMGSLNIKATYEIHSGQRGDYHTETISPSINIVDVELVSIEGGDSFDTFLYHLTNEIEEHLGDEEAS
jgi:hypothetical protein